MSKELSAFHPVAGFENVFTAQKGTLRCTAVHLATGGLCLYSPVQGLGQVARDSLSALGQVTHLLAPNHYHNKGLHEFHTAFPAAKLCCTPAAAPRLAKQTGLSFESLADVESDLCEEMQCVEPQGLKTGEVWLRQATNDATLWIVTDAFCGAKGPVGAIVQTPELLGPFPKFGIQDRTVYAEWLAGEIKNHPPTTILPCHGSVISSNRLGDAALQLIEGL